MATCSFFGRNIFCVVTGASRGIGKTIAIEFARRSSGSLAMVLVARSEEGLKGTKSRILELKADAHIETVALDLTKPSPADYERILNDALNNAAGLGLNTGVIFHNVGQMGRLTKALNLNDLEVWRNFYDLNVFSVTLLNSVFVRKMRDLEMATTVVNISSLCGSIPFKDMTLYCSTRAARSMYFRILAQEEEDVVVLNYCPGPVDTDMYQEVLENLQSSDVKKMFVDTVETKKILTTEQTVAKLFDILVLNKFKSGDVIDYFD